MSQNSSKTRFPLKRALAYGVLLPVWVFAGFMLAQVLIAGLLWLLGNVGVSFTAVNETVFNSVISAVIYAVSIALVVGLPWAIAKRRTSKEELGLQRAPDWMDILWAPGAMVIYYILSAILMVVAMFVLPFVDYEQVQQTGYSGISTQLEYVLAFMSLVVIAPVAEEVLFRGYLLGKLRRHMKTWLAVIMTSLLFAIVHFQWNVGIDTFALSVVLCMLRITTKSIWAPILVHALKNGIAFYLLFINPSLIGTIGG